MAPRMSTLFDPATLERNVELYPLPYDTQPVRLCGTCWATLNPRVLHEESRTEWNHHSNVTSLQRAAEARCYFCARIWESIEAWELVLLESKSTYSTSVKIDGYRHQEAFTINFSIGSWRLPRMMHFSLFPFRGNIFSCNSDEARGEIRAKILMDPETCNGMKVSTDVMYHPPESTGSRDALDLAHIWMQQCVATHRACQRQFTQSGKPRRLIHFSNTTNSWRLKWQPEGEECPPYVALSHCWGTDDAYMPRLTKDTFESFRFGSPLSNLPRTFQEAIYVAKDLGFEYIWIDSLCILQDSKRDWEEQAIIMSQIYHLAELTICATKAVNGSEGCFVDRKPTDLPPRLLQVALGPEESVREYLLLDASYLQSLVLKSALNSRCWVIQERFTSRRKLHFTKDQIYWECCERQACETYPSSIPSAMMDAYNRSFQQGLEQAFVISELFDNGPDGIWPKEFPKRAIYLTWRGIVHQYMARKLTEPSDKLPALQSLASIFGVVTKDTYQAGIWADDVPYGLLWRVDLRHQETVRPSFYRAPSWSWASVDGHIHAYWIKNGADAVDSLDGVHIQEMEFLVNPDESDSIHVQRKLWLKLRGHIFRIKVGHFTWANDDEKIEIMQNRIYFYPDQRNLNSKGDVFFLPILHTIDASKLCEGEYCFCGLLLNISSAEDPAPNEYVRIGCAYIVGKEVMDAINDHKENTSVSGFEKMLEYVSRQELHIA